MAWAALFRALAWCHYSGGGGSAAAAGGGDGVSSVTRSSQVRQAVQVMFLWIVLLAHWLALLALASGTLVCAAVEHVYFWSTR